MAPEIASGRVIVGHLGNGASLCAMDNLRSVECTLGFTALDGLCMGTRPGALDPGVVLHLLQGLGLSALEVEAMLYRKSGLLGISGISSDMRVLLEHDEPSALLAVEYFVYRAAREIGALAAVLGGIDGLVFTAGIGENSPEIRAQICARCAWLGVELDAAANEQGGPRISRPRSRVSAWVIPTDEELMIARHTGELLGLSAREIRHLNVRGEQAVELPFRGTVRMLGWKAAALNRSNNSNLSPRQAGNAALMAARNVCRPAATSVPR